MTITTTSGAAQTAPDTTGDLFPSAYPRVELETMIEVEGYTFRVTFRDTSLAEALAVLKRKGCTPAATNGNGKPKRERLTPIYNGQDEPCCPTHKKPLREGKYGLYCPAKNADGSYCDLKFTE